MKTTTHHGVDDVHAKDLVSLRVSEHLHEAVSVHVRLGTVSPTHAHAYIHVSVSVYCGFHCLYYTRLCNDMFCRCSECFHDYSNV